MGRMWREDVGKLTKSVKHWSLTRMLVFDIHLYEGNE